VTSSQCPTCKHYRLNKQCAAFPDGIPTPILLGQHDHTDPWPTGWPGIRVGQPVFESDDEDLPAEPTDDLEPRPNEGQPDAGGDSGN
jgi:hypothetical protein